MTRNEEIRNAIDTTFPIRPSNNGRTYEQALMAAGFKYGVSWADSHPTNMWHDANEEPKCKKLIVIYRDDIGCIPIDTLIYAGDADCHWKELVKTYNIIYWAYAKYILPKGGDEDGN